MKIILQGCTRQEQSVGRLKLSDNFRELDVEETKEKSTGEGEKMRMES